MPLSASRALAPSSLRSPAPASAANARPPSRGRSASTSRGRALAAPAAAAAVRSSSPPREAPLAPPDAAAATPQPLTKTAARVVVKAVRNAIYPPKDNPFAAEGAAKDPSRAANARTLAAACMERAREASAGSQQCAGMQHRRVVAANEEKPGHHFLRAVRAETARLNALVEVVEREMAEEPQMPEEMQEKLRAVSGQARLLLKKKMQQFEGLCQKNITQKPGEVFPTTGQDLAGFWDMVKLQIDQVDRWFAEIDALRRAGWSEPLEAAIGAGESEAAGAGAGAGPLRPQKKASAGKTKSVSAAHRRNSIVNPDSFEPGSAPTFTATSPNRGLRAERFQSAGKAVDKTAAPVGEARGKSSDTRRLRDKTPGPDNRWTP